MEDDSNLASILHKELLEISNRNSEKRFQNLYNQSSKESSFHALSLSDITLERNQKEPNLNPLIIDNANRFLQLTKEKVALNQYWYSHNTIQTLTSAVIQVSHNIISKNDGRKIRIAFLSTPSLYFAIPSQFKDQHHCMLFEYDHDWSYDTGYVHYDFNAPLQLDPHFKGSFDIVVIDPPFISHSVWRMYASTAEYLLQHSPRPNRTLQDHDDQHGTVIATTVKENQDLMMELFHASPTRFKPSVPNLVYQYEIYINAECEVLSLPNPEIQSSL